MVINIFVLQIPIRSFHRKLKSLTIEHSSIENIPANASFICGLNLACPDLEVNVVFYVMWHYFDNYLSVWATKKKNSFKNYYNLNKKSQ